MITELINKIIKRLFKTKEKTTTLPKDYYTSYNGVAVHWFIGDGLDFGRSHLFHAWGSCKDNSGNVRAYQLHGVFNPQTRELIKIMVLNDPNNFYHHQETYERLTK